MNNPALLAKLADATIDTLDEMCEEVSHGSRRAVLPFVMFQKSTAGARIFVQPDPNIRTPLDWPRLRAQVRKHLQAGYALALLSACGAGAWIYLPGPGYEDKDEAWASAALDQCYGLKRAKDTEGRTRLGINKVQ